MKERVEEGRKMAELKMTPSPGRRGRDLRFEPKRARVRSERVRKLKSDQMKLTSDPFQQDSTKVH